MAVARTKEDYGSTTTHQGQVTWLLKHPTLPSLKAIRGNLAPDRTLHDLPGTHTKAYINTYKNVLDGSTKKDIPSSP